MSPPGEWPPDGTMMETIDCLVVGAGVIGLAVARALALAGREVVILESESAIGSHTSSRNSEVIHAGIYYPPGSLMARFCLAGRTMLYPFCDEHGVAVRRCGKLIVATSEAEVDRLQAIAARASENGVDDLALLSGAEARRCEPALTCLGALSSPSTGILDSHAYMLSLLGDAEAAGAVLALSSPCLGARVAGNGLVVEVGGAEPISIRTNLLVNAAGLGAPAVAGTVEGLSPHAIPTSYLAKGNYFVLARPSPFSRLIYPVPVAGGLGIHLTLDLAGRARFGPDVEWVSQLDYAVDPARAAAFVEAIRRYWPEIREQDLTPGYAGIRPKIASPGAPNQDFRIDDLSVHGVPGLINLFGIESPGLTASLAIADHVLMLSNRAPAS